MLLLKCSGCIVVVVFTINLAQTISFYACWIQPGHVNDVVKPDENSMICIGVLTLGICSVIKSVNNDTDQSYGTPWRESSKIMNSKDNNDDKIIKLGTKSAYL